MENPTTHSDLELFTRTLNWDTRSTISKIYAPAVFGAFGFGIALVSNFFQRKPLMSGVQKHVVLTALGIPVGLFVEQKVEMGHARRDAALVYYMQTHPEDFPVTERKKFKDVLEKWLPRR